MVIVMVKASHQEINVSVSNVPKSDGHATVCECTSVYLSNSGPQCRDTLTNWGHFGSPMLFML